MDHIRAKATRHHTKHHNSRLVLQTIYDSGEISRADLARATQLTRTTVSDVVSDLLSLGLVEEVGQAPTAVGRTPTLLSVVDDSRHMVAVNITANELQGALVNLRGGIRHQAQAAVQAQDGAAVLERLYLFIDDLVRAASSPLLGIGICTPGLVDTDSGLVRLASNVGWHDLPLGSLVQQRVNLPVYVARDSHALALAEYMFSPHQQTTNLVVIKVGRGVGAGIILNGQLFYGDSFGAGEIGHVVVVENGPLCSCGNAGCLEALVSVQAIVARARVAANADRASLLHRFADGGAALTLEHVHQAYLEGDPAVRRMIEQTGRFLGVAVANLVGVLNIRRVVVAGRLAIFGDALCDAIQQELRQRVLPSLAHATVIEVAPQAADMTLIGASALLLTHKLGLTRLRQRAAPQGVLDARPQRAFSATL